MAYPGSIFLFDIDGVMVEPLGYRAATDATLRYFIDRLGIDPGLTPNPARIEWFEAMHITSEWDMVPISLALILEAIVTANPNIKLPASASGLGRLKGIQVNPQVDYYTALSYLSRQLSAGEYPSATALRLAGEHISPNGDPHPGLFPRLSDSSLLREILTHSRDPYRSPTTRIFQHFSLGSDVFHQVYGLPIEVETPSLLKACDAPQFSISIQQTLRERINNGQLAMAAVTNRPSSPPRGAPDQPAGYPPEAEMALEINGMVGLPLISFGGIRYLAERHGLEPETLIKPSPVQGTAAILAALTGREYQALKTALHLVQGNLQGSHHWIELDLGLSPQAMPPMLNIHIFEDTRWGIESTRLAGSLLKNAGIPNTVFAWGIAQNEAKIASLQEIEASVFTNTSSAIQAALELV